MACSVSNGRVLPCKSSVGGIKAIYISDYNSAITALTPVNGVVTLAGTETFYKYEVKGGTNLDTAINSSRDTGTTFYSSTLNVSLTYLDAATQEEIKLLAAGRLHVVVEDYNGNAFLLGKAVGAEVTGGTIVTGTNFGDASGFTLTISADDPSAPYFLAAAPTDSSVAPINPTA